MADLIDRDKAIDALGEMPEGDDDWTSGCRYQWKLDTKLLRTLPSAQPELPDICNGCEVRFVHGCDTECKKNVLKKYSAQPEVHDSQKEVEKYVTAFSDGYDRGKQDAWIPYSVCDLCIYNPPSSMDGKPCSMCVAQDKPKDPDSWSYS